MVKIDLDHSGIAKFLKSSKVAAMTKQAAEDIAQDVRRQAPDAEEVVVDEYETDRAAASVTIRDVRGRLWQVRDGILTRAAAGKGVEVTEK